MTSAYSVQCERTNQLVAFTSAYTSLMGEVIVIVILCVTTPEPSGKKKCPRLIDLAAAPRFTNLRHHRASVPGALHGKMFR